MVLEKCSLKISDYMKMGVCCLCYLLRDLFSVRRRPPVTLGRPSVYVSLSRITKWTRQGSLPQLPTIETENTHTLSITLIMDMSTSSTVHTSHFSGESNCLIWFFFWIQFITIITFYFIYSVTMWRAWTFVLSISFRSVPTSNIFDTFTQSR